MANKPSRATRQSAEVNRFTSPATRLEGRVAPVRASGADMTAAEFRQRDSTSKYGNRRVVADGYRFDSAGEHARYKQLKILQQAGVISGLAVHPRWELTVNGVKIGRYTADFSYTEKGRLVVEDFKGVRTRDFILRKKLMRALHGIDVREVTR